MVCDDEGRILLVLKNEALNAELRHTDSRCIYTALPSRRGQMKDTLKGFLNKYGVI